MEGKIVALFLVALLGGLIGGFGLSYIISQPQIHNLENKNTNIENQVQNLLNTATSLQNQFANLNTTLQSLLNMSRVETNNQVQVSGTTSQTHMGDIQFVSLDKTISTSTVITNSQYSLLLVGGQSYTVKIYDSQSYDTYTYSLYVPLGVTTFSGNF